MSVLATLPIFLAVATMQRYLVRHLARRGQGLIVVTQTGDRAAREPIRLWVARP